MLSRALIVSLIGAIKGCITKGSGMSSIAICSFTLPISLYTDVKSTGVILSSTFLILSIKSTLYSFAYNKASSIFASSSLSFSFSGDRLTGGVASIASSLELN